jgi:SulP family sulfate permease
LRRSLTALCQQRPRLRTVILDASGMNQLDSSALDALLEIDGQLASQGIRLLFAEVKGPVRDVLQRAGWLASLREQGRIFLRVHDAVLSDTRRPECGVLGGAALASRAWLSASGSR